MGYLLVISGINPRFEIFFSGMRQFNRILGFVAVSFVLLFLGRVSKTSLYTVYFKTIAEVEIRNSQALDFGDAHFDIATSNEVVSGTNVVSGGSAAILQGFELQSRFSGASGSPVSTGNAAIPIALRCFMEVAPRAPGA
ncbi:MAG: hypothetical protein RLZZ519_3067 [Bacteroidota bacterium]